MFAKFPEYAGDGAGVAAVREAGAEPDPVPHPPLHPLHLLTLLLQVKSTSYLRHDREFIHNSQSKIPMQIKSFGEVSTTCKESHC